MPAAIVKSLPAPTLPWPTGCGLGLCALLVGWLFHPLAAALWQAWTTDPNYSHGPLVVLAACGLAVMAWRRHAAGAQASVKQEHFIGPVMLSIALLLHGVAWLLDFTLLDAVALVALLLAILLWIGGPALRRDLGFPVLLLLLAAPLPVAWYQPLALALQNLISTAAANLFALCGQSVYREGFVIHLSGRALEVGAACSGIRQLTAYLALGAVIGHLARRGRGFTVALVAVAVVMAVGANLLRIMLTGWLMLLAGSQAASGVFHTLEGLATLAIGAAGLLAAAVLLARLDDWRKKSLPVHQAGNTDQRSPGLASSRVPLAPPVLLAILTLAVLAQSIAQRNVAAVPLTPAALVAPLNQLPRQIGAWHGTDMPSPANAAWADQHVRRDYRHRETGQTVVVWITYSASGADRAHHPEICMDVAGRSEQRHRRAALAVAGGPPIAEFVYGDRAVPLNTWYWHYSLPEVGSGNGHALANLYHRARQRRASVSVEVICGEDSPAARAAARDFVVLLNDALRPLVPTGAVRGSERLPVGFAMQTDRTDQTDRSDRFSNLEIFS